MDLLIFHYISYVQHDRVFLSWDISHHVFVYKLFVIYEHVSISSWNGYWDYFFFLVIIPPSSLFKHPDRHSMYSN